MADGRADRRRSIPATSTRRFAIARQDQVHVDVWWTSGAQVEQMLDFRRSRHDRRPGCRVRSPRRRAGAPVEIVWNQDIWGGDNWSILAGTPNADACREFIKFASDPKRQAALVEYFPAGLTQPEAFNYIKPEIAKNCPTYPDNIKAGLKIDAKYWHDNQAVVHRALQ